MISGLGGVSIWSSDVKNLVPFYRDVVGLKLQMETPEFVLFGEPNVPALGIGKHSEVKGKTSDPYRIMVGFRTDDVKAEFARMKAAGADFIEEPTEQPDGGLVIATFRDPEGNIGQLFQFTG
jgi:predicted enzyme related to lactoylglutathione lyase